MSTAFEQGEGKALRRRQMSLGSCYEEWVMVPMRIYMHVVSLGDDSYIRAKR